MHPVKQRLQALLAQAKGTRWDVLASKTCFTLCAGLTVVAGLAPYTGFVPGRVGTIATGIVGMAGALLPRATKVAGMIKAAQDQKTPFLKIVPQLLQTLLTAPQITADAKAKADAQAKADQAKETMALVNQAIDSLEARFSEKIEKSGVFASGSGPDNLSDAVPAGLKQAPPEAQTEEPTQTGGLSSVVAVGDKQE